MEVGFKTDRGLRRSNNEDACFVMKRDKVFIVADGVGGNNSGEIASRTAVNEIAGYIETHSLEELKTCIQNVCKLLFFQLRKRRPADLCPTEQAAVCGFAYGIVFAVHTNR